VPQLDVGARSTHRASFRADALTRGGGAGWDVAVFARLTWRARGGVALIPTRRELRPEAWDEPCLADGCTWEDLDQEQGLAELEEPAP
jgi:hypothetical protein